MELLKWWLSLTLQHGPGGLVVGGLVAAVAAIAVLAVLTGLLHAVGFVKRAFVVGWHRGWDRDRDAGDLARQQKP